MKSNAFRNTLPFRGLAIVSACAATLGVASARSVSRDLDGDGIANLVDPDVDGDGIPNGRDRNVDGGVCRRGPFKGSYVGDRFLNGSPLEKDIDGDGLKDDSAAELDIDGDGKKDDAPNENDIDGDGTVNELDKDCDGDGKGRGRDQDDDGDGIDDENEQGDRTDAEDAIGLLVMIGGSGTISGEVTTEELVGPGSSPPVSDGTVEITAGECAEVIASEDSAAALAWLLSLPLTERDVIGFPVDWSIWTMGDGETLPDAELERQDGARGGRRERLEDEESGETETGATPEVQAADEVVF